MPVCSVTVVRCTGLEHLTQLPVGSTLGSCYVTVLVRDNLTGETHDLPMRTKSRFRTNRPDFRQTFSFQLPEGQATRSRASIEISVVDGKADGRLLGVCSLSLNEDWKGWLELDSITPDQRKHSVREQPSSASRILGGGSNIPGRRARRRRSASSSYSLSPGGSASILLESR